MSAAIVSNVVHSVYVMCPNIRLGCLAVGVSGLCPDVNL